MKTLTSSLAALAITATGLALFPAAANAAYIPDPTPPKGAYSITVNDFAARNATGSTAWWHLQFKCAKGETYTVNGEIRQSAPTKLAAPYASWSATYTAALGEATGECTGGTQNISLVLKTTRTLIFSPTGASASVWLPLKKSPTALVAKAYLHTPKTAERGNPYYCSYVAGPYEDGTVCEDATQIGPKLRVN